MAFLTLTTQRLVLRAPRLDDLGDFLAYRNHPDNLRFQAIEPQTERDALAFLARQAALDIDAGPCWMMCALELRGADGPDGPDGADAGGAGRMIGEVGLYLAPAKASAANIGWSLHPDVQGRGYATEAARALLDFAFGERRLHRVTANGDPRNAASTRVMERLGMRREGSMRKSRFSKGEWHDEYLYAILAEEWR